MNARKVIFHLRENPEGNLSFLEGQRDLPFSIKRAYYIYNVPFDGRRGFHAHKELEQCLICLNGSCKTGRTGADYNNICLHFFHFVSSPIL